MSLFKNLFKTKDEPVKTCQQFWDWFSDNQKLFYSVVKDKGDIQRFFFSKLAGKLKELREGIFFLTGMFDKNTVELILTPDGSIKDIYFVEELIAAAPQLKGWRFTALKPASDIKDTRISMGDYQFTRENISFYAKEHPGRPDEIDLVVVHDDYNEKQKAAITNGVYIFLDNFLGELNFATTIDNLTVTGKNEAKAELIPIEKLKAFLTWRQAEFIEKYEGLRHGTEHDSYAVLEAGSEGGNKMIATINTDLLNWDGRASHPWMLHIEIKYGEAAVNNGMPGEDDSAMMIVLEDSLMEQLKDVDGYLNIGHTTGDGARDIYFACKDFRKPAMVTDELIAKYADTLKVEFNIYKDKYWRSAERFRPGL